MERRPARKSLERAWLERATEELQRPSSMCSRILHAWVSVVSSCDIPDHFSAALSSVPSSGRLLFRGLCVCLLRP
jgi:hypothetical protein